MRLAGGAIAAGLLAAMACTTASCLYPAFSFGVPLPCGDGRACQLGQVCCFAPLGGDAVCRLSGQCPLAHVEFGCRTADEGCAAGESCCAVDEDHDGFPDVVRCARACATGDLALCETSADCAGERPCLQMFVGLASYRACKP
jgi:hypothetical protein